MRSDWSSGQPADLEPLLNDLDRQRLEIDRRELTWATGAALVVASGEHQRYGFSNPVDWLRIRCRMGEGAVRDRICVGQQRRHLAASVAALEAGAIGFGHLVLIAQTRQALDRGRKGPLIFDELKLLGRAGDETVGRFFYTCENYRHACNPPAFAEAAEDLYEQRELLMRRRRDGLYTMWGRLDAVGAAAVRGSLAPLARRRGRDDRRTFPQRLHDALVEFVGGAEPVQLNVTVAAETLLGLSGAPAGEVEKAPPISQRTIERLSCDSTVRRVLLDPKSVVIEVGRTRRVVSPAARQALVARDGSRCAWPDCDRPGTIVHHLRHWCRGGTTDLPNQLLICACHHRMLHEGGWQMVRKENGALLTLRPPPTFGHRARGPDATAAA